MGNKTLNCTGCSHCVYGSCMLLAGVDCTKIEKCILEYAEIKSIQMDTLDYFIINRDPKTYLNYLGWKEKENYPKVGEKLVRLTSGFDSAKPGDIVTVVEDDDQWHIFIQDERDIKSCIPKSDWYKDVFRLQGYGDNLDKGSEFKPTGELFLATNKTIKNVIKEDGFKDVILGKNALAAVKVIGGGIIYKVDAVGLVDAGYKLYSTSNEELITADEVPSSYIIIEK